MLFAQWHVMRRRASAPPKICFRPNSMAPVVLSFRYMSENKVAADESVAAPFHGLSFSVGVAENKNRLYRDSMEDVHTYIANFAERVDWGYFAVFDGHAGKNSARWCGNNLHAVLELQIGQDDHDLTPMVGVHDLQECLHQSFLKADEMIQAEGVGNSGCTAAVAVIRWESLSSSPSLPVTEPVASSGSDTASNSPFDFVPQAHHRRVIYTSNVGDSRIVLYREGKPYRLSYDHKASDANEIARIRAAGGLVMKNRVNGVLAVSRSLGDTYMKDLVIGKPFTTRTEISDADEFMIIACDGVWDVISDLKACEYVLEIFKDEIATPQLAAKKLCNLAMENMTTDNVTVMVVKFDPKVFAPQLLD